MTQNEMPDLMYIEPIDRDRPQEGYWNSTEDNGDKYYHERVLKFLKDKNTNLSCDLMTALTTRRTPDMQELQAKLDKAVDALRFYADKKSWETRKFNGLGKRIPFTIQATNDRGNKARKTLEELG